jgi:hypothetical protein
MENGSPHSRYMLLDVFDNTCTATFRAIEYDWHGAAGTARQNSRPDWAHALATGYAVR